MSFACDLILIAVDDDITPGVAIDRKYLLDNQKLSKQQCLRAAYRLAHILNECLK